MAFFQDFPVLENAITKFQDFPGFPGPVRTLEYGYFRELHITVLVTFLMSCLHLERRVEDQTKDCFPMLRVIVLLTWMR